MVLAFGHLIGAWLIGKFVEITTKKKISQNTWVFLILGSILPDFDFVLQLLFQTHLHRGITHSIFFAIIVPMFVYFIFKFIKNKKAANYALFLSVGILVHLLLDFPSPEGIPLLWPYAKMFIPAVSLETSRLLFDVMIDSILGVSWIFYLALKKRIQF
jgi:membrane-bound metal-dependent hydrolase YbcI (DUF457 family)